MPFTVVDAVSALEVAYPPALAESWDTGIGLTCGDPAQSVTTVLLAIDADAAVVDQAIALRAQLLVTHHPLLFRPVQSVAVDTDKGSLIHRLIRAGIAHYAAHTNADKAVGGVNDALAAALGLLEPVPLVPDPDGSTGSGRVGRLCRPVTLSQFADRVALALPATAGGLRVAGDPDRMIRRVAVSGGAGGSYLGAAAAAGVDVVVTSDLNHHTVAEHIADPARPAVVEVAHWAGEWPWLANAAAVITAAAPRGPGAGSLTTTVSRICTDPWSRHRPSGPVPAVEVPTPERS